MYNTRLSVEGELFEPKASKFKTRTVFILAIVINVEVATTEASFLVFKPMDT